ncbi:MAG: SurA N-terminal domain-containing protein [Marinilabiliaceae bacterium]|nr:SurA N-terminal domain-containing protein [Marinilabiliaceae bacterium]
MATLERIRNRAGLVILIIGLGLVAFLLTDFLNSGSSLFKGTQQQIGEVNGTSISYPEYQNYLSELEEFAKLSSGKAALDENTSYQLRDQAWNQLVQDVIMDEKYEELGIQVTVDELVEMTTGNSVHPQIRQMFTNPQTGVFDKNQLITFLKQKNSDPTANFYWMYLEKQITKERLFAKYRDLIKKGMYVTTAQAKAEAEAKQNKVSFDFIVKRFTSIPDSTVTIAESDIKSYYNAHLDNYKQEATRDVEYVMFEVKPSAEDKTMAEEWITQAKKDFGAPETDAIQYVNMNSESNHIDRKLKVEQLSTTLQDFVADAQEGDVYGPYFENETYKLSRLVEIAQVPDSVKARHILIRGNAPEKDEAIADSLLNLINNGADFAKLAREYSQDPGSGINGGDLGWFTEGKMVQPFNDACFKGKKGDVVKVASQFGFHIINIQDKGRPVTKYNIATLERKIDYSSKTNQIVYAKAAKFAAMNNSQEKFNEAIQTENLVKRFGRSLKANDRNVGALESPREMVRWAFEAEVGDMSPIFEFGDTYVLAVMTNAREEGNTPVNVVKGQIERQLRNDKKAELLIADMNTKKQNSSSMSALAQNLDVEVQNASNIDFAAYQVPGAGIEPALVALATTAKQGEMSAPVAGNNGVFVVKVNTVEAGTVDVASEKAQLQQSASFKVDYKALEAIRGKAEITDERIKIF